MKMQSTQFSWQVCLAALAGSVASTALFAQDSVSRNANAGNGLPGDALSPWGTGNAQRANYIVDMTPFHGSWGTTFSVAPIVRSGKVSTQRFNAVNGPSTLSTTMRTGVAFPAASYTLWTSAGGGLNTSENNLTLNTTVSPTGLASVFGVGVLEFDENPFGASLAFINQVVGAQVAFKPELPTRLYVTRVPACVNAPSGQGDRSQLGLGSVDADGNVCLRADGFAATTATTTSILTGDNYFRVRLPARNNSFNMIDNAGASQAASTDYLLQHSANLTAAPSAIPADLGTRSVLVGADFLGNIFTETSANVLTTTNTHRPGTTDHRAGPSVSGKPLFAGSVATGAILSRSTTGGGRTESISVFGLSASGSVVGQRTLSIPASITDTCDAFSWPINGGEFKHYDSQVTFRGGSGPAATGKDFAGRALAAATLYNGSQPGTNNPYNAIVAARFDPTSPTSPVSWTAVAWVNTVANDGKDILGDNGLDGAPNTGDLGENDGMVNGLDAPIGRLASTSEGPSGLVGPSLSAPAFDAAGNCYFLATVALRKQAGPVIVDEFDTALIRAVYDPATFCYTLEMLLEPGMTFSGQNSARPYRLSWLGVADSDSISSASLWSSSVSSQAWNNADTSNFIPQSPQHLGGLVLSARIVYDVNLDGQFQDPTDAGGNVNSTDEAYNTVLYVANTTPLGPVCDSIDFNTDGLFPDTADIDDFLSVFSGGPCSTGTCNDIDFNNDGLFPDTTDIDAFLSVFSGGPCL